MRDELAAQIANGLLAAGDTAYLAGGYEKFAWKVYKYTDAMLKVRDDSMLRPELDPYSKGA